MDYVVRAVMYLAFQGMFVALQSLELVVRRQNQAPPCLEATFYRAARQRV